MGDDLGHYEIDGQVRCEADGVDGEIKEMDDGWFAGDEKKIILVDDKKGDNKEKKIVVLDEKKKAGVRVSEKEKEVRRDKEQREREREQQQHKQRQREHDGKEHGVVSPISPLSPPAWRTEETGTPFFDAPVAIMPEPEKFMVEEFKALKEKDEANIKFRFEGQEETRHKYLSVEQEGEGTGTTQKYMKVDMPPSAASGKGHEGSNKEDELP